LPFKGELFSFLSAILWAFAVILFKKSGENVHPFALNFFKSSFAFILFIPTIIFFDISFLQGIPLEYFIILLLSGVIGIAGGDTLFFMSLNNLGASLTGIVYCLYSPFIIFLSISVLGEKLTIPQAIGAITIISAVFLATYVKKENKNNKITTGKGILFGILANLAFAVSVVIMKPLLGEYPVIWSTEVRLAGGIIGLILIFILRKDRNRIIKTLLKKESWSYMITGSFVGTYLAMLFWVAGMKFTLASIASALNQTNTIFIFLFAALFLGEPFTKKKIIAVILAMAGTILVSLF